MAFASSTGETISNPASEVRIGATNSSAVDATVDDIRLDSAAMPGPSGSGGATATPTNTPTRTATPTNTPVGPTATYTYDMIGNMTSKAGVNRTYGPTGSGPHQARTVGGQTYSYDANGNLQSAGTRTCTWMADNLLASAPVGSVTESYTYDADGERVAKSANGGTTVFFAGVWVQKVGAAPTRDYTFNGQVVATRNGSTNAVTYLHGDHLGSISLATDSNGAVVSNQDFDPWGKARGSSTIAQTSLNYTGQRLDGTGLRYYHARYYDPGLARFVSADSVVPGSASGGMDGVALKGLTVDFHEPGFVGGLNGENGQAFWFQLTDDEQGKAGSPWGPANPQALNRYSYVQNNPLGATDPNGHTRVEAKGSDGRIYGYEEARNADGSVITDKPDGTGNVLYQTYVCNYNRTDCSVAHVWSDSQDFKNYKSQVDTMLGQNRAINAAMVTTLVSFLAASAACAATAGLACLSLLVPAGSAGVLLYQIQQLEDTTTKAQLSFSGIWSSGSQRTINRQQHVTPADYDSRLPSSPVPDSPSIGW